MYPHIIKHYIRGPLVLKLRSMNRQDKVSENTGSVIYLLGEDHKQHVWHHRQLDMFRMGDC